MYTVPNNVNNALAVKSQQAIIKTWTDVLLVSNGFLFSVTNSELVERVDIEKTK